MEKRITFEDAKKLAQGDEWFDYEGREILRDAIEDLLARAQGNGGYCAILDQADRPGQGVDLFPPERQWKILGIAPTRDVAIGNEACTEIWIPTI